LSITKTKSDPMNCLSENGLIKFTFVAFKVAEMSLPAYSCEYSKQTYTQHQLMALICLMKRLRLKYREIVEVVDLMPDTGNNWFKRNSTLHHAFKNRRFLIVRKIRDFSTAPEVL